MKHSPIHQRRTRNQPCPICLDRFIRRHYRIGALDINREPVYGGSADRLLDLQSVLQILDTSGLKVNTETETKEFLDGYCVPRESYIVKDKPRRNRWRHWVTPVKGQDIYVRAGDLVKPIAEALKFERSLQTRSGS